MKTLCALAVLTSCLPGAASAEAWYRLGVAPDQGSIVYADAGGLSTGDGAIRSAWFDTYYNPKSAAPFASASSQDHDEFDCAARTIRIVTSIYYTPAGGVGHMGVPDPIPSPVRPDSVGEAKFLFACYADHGGVTLFPFTPQARNPAEASSAYFIDLDPLSSTPVVRQKVILLHNADKASAQQ